MRTRLLVMVGFLSLLAVGSASGQQEAKVEANIPFQFTVEGKVLPAGQYTLTRKVGDDFFRVVGPDNAGVLAPVITRLGGEIHTTPADAHIVFDKLGDTYYLSEIWIPGEDGFLLHTTKEAHTHRTVNVPR
jgi:hypothetical protein